MHVASDGDRVDRIRTVRETGFSRFETALVIFKYLQFVGFSFKSGI